MYTDRKLRWLFALLLLCALVGRVAAAELVLKAEEKADQLAESLWFELPFTLTAPGQSLTALELKVTAEVKALEQASQVLIPEDLFIQRGDGSDPPNSLARGESLPLKLRARLPGPGTYRIPVQVTARELDQPVTQTLLLRASGVKLDSPPSPAYSFTYENEPAFTLWGLSTLLRDLTKAALGTGIGTDCYHPVLNVRSTGLGLGAQATYQALAFFDQSHARAMPNAQFYLIERADANCSEAAAIEVGSEDPVKPYALGLRPADPTQRIMPGTYSGHLLIKHGFGAERLPVTVHVRNGLGMVFMVALLGIGLHFLMGWLKRVASKEELYPRLVRIRRQIRERYQSMQAAPRFLRKVADWCERDLHGATPKEIVQHEIALVEGLLARADFNAWVEGFNDLLVEDDPLWGQILSNFFQEKDTTLTNLHEKAAGLIKKYKGRDLTPPPEPNFQAEQVAPPEKPRDWALVLPIGMLWGARILLFAVAVVAGLWAAIGLYLGTPAFGAEPFKDYGGIFMIGFVGTKVNEVLQKLTEGIAPQKS